MFRKLITIILATIVLTSAFLVLGQSISSASTASPSKLSIYAGPPSLLADNSTYNCVFVQLQDSSGLPARALQDTTISLSSSVIIVGKIDSSIIIPKGTTYASVSYTHLRAHETGRK